jgi:hypothetical protein
MLVPDSPLCGFVKLNCAAEPDTVPAEAIGTAAAAGVTSDAEEDDHDVVELPRDDVVAKQTTERLKAHRAGNTTLSVGNGWYECAHTHACLIVGLHSLHLSLICLNIM